MFPTQENWSTRQQGPQSLIGVTADWSVPNCLWNYDSFVASLGGPERKAGMSKCVFDWFSIDWPLLRSVGMDSQHKADRSAL